MVSIPGSGAVTTFHTVTGLNNGVVYTLRVGAKNAAGAGSAADAIDATPKAAQQVPAEFEEFDAKQTGVGQVELEWRTADPLTVSSYQLAHDNGGSWTPIANSNSGTTSYIVSGLEVGTTYTFTVGVVNRRGVTESNPISVTIFSKPSPPTGLGAEPGDEQVSVRWNVPSVDADRPIVKHQLLQVRQSKLTAAGGVDNDKFGYSVAIDVNTDANTAVVGAPGANTGKGAVYVFTRDSNTGPWSQASTLTAPDGLADDEFGISVGVDGDTIVVGAPQDDARNGAAYVFTKPNTLEGWVSTSTAATLTAPDGLADDEFGISVAIHEDTVVVGAYKADYVDANDSSNNRADSGAAYVFTKPNTLEGWVATSTAATLTASDGAANDESGISVAIDDSTVVVGANGHESNQGAVYVFTKAATDDWTDTTETSKLTASDGTANDEFGISVAVDVDTIVVGAHQHDANSNSGAGAAYVFIRNSGVWGQTSKLTASNGDSDDGFGISVAVDVVGDDEDTIVVGANLDDNSLLFHEDSGSVYVFVREPDVWSQPAKLLLPDSDGMEEDDRFGRAVAVFGDSIIVGAPQDDVEIEDSTEVEDAGSIYVMPVPRWTGIPQSAAESLSHTVTGLTNGVEYTFQVRAVDDQGAGSLSDIVRATPVPAPDAPINFSATPEDGQVVLSWDYPNDPSINRYEYHQAEGVSGFGPIIIIPRSGEATTELRSPT